MNTWFKKYGAYLKNEKFLAAFAFSFFLLIASLVINFFAGLYATERASSPVTDIILNNIPVFNVDLVFVYGTWVFWIFTAFICFSRLNTFPFTVKSIALFTLIRSAFITLTHIGPFPNRLPVDVSGVIGKFSLGGDLFFSGHTGLPFLLALVFWRNKKLRYIFLASSFIFGSVVLLGHLHYSIDVAAAFFITYTISHIAERLFKKDRKFFYHGLEGK